MPEATVNVEALYAALDNKRTAAKMSWRDLAGQLKVSPSTFTRMAQGRRPDVDTFAQLLSWLSMPADNFITGNKKGNIKEADPMAMISSFLRSSRNIRAKDAEALEDILQAAYRRLVQDK